MAMGSWDSDAEAWSADTDAWDVAYETLTYTVTLGASEIPAATVSQADTADLILGALQSDYEISLAETTEGITLGESVSEYATIGFGDTRTWDEDVLSWDSDTELWDHAQVFVVETLTLTVTEDTSNVQSFPTHTEVFDITVAEIPESLVLETASESCILAEVLDSVCISSPPDLLENLILGVLEGAYWGLWDRRPSSETNWDLVSAASDIWTKDNAHEGASGNWRLDGSGGGIWRWDDGIGGTWEGELPLPGP